MRTERVIGWKGSEWGDEAVEELLRRSRQRVSSALRRVRRPEAALGVVKSPLGELLVALSGKGLVLVHYLLGGSDLETTLARLRLLLDPVEDSRTVKTIGAEVNRYLAGEADALRQQADLRLVTTEFQNRVLRELEKIPRGAVVSYQALGARAGAPQAARAVGNALHNNPVPIYVPCHRVITSDGGLGGYGGGSERKLQLLRSEGFELGRADRKLPDNTVWGNKGSKIYCRKNCRALALVDRERVVFFADAGYAEQAGMRPCKICRPAQGNLCSKG